MIAAVEERFWAKVRLGDSCWEWQGSREPKGYGKFMDKATRHSPLKAHRVSWEIANGPISPGTWVLHHCDNPSCVRPSHLFLGDARTNAADMVAKGRHMHQIATHCKQGHAFDEANTARRSTGSRICRTCRTLDARERARQIRAARSPEERAAFNANRRVTRRPKAASC